MLNKAFIERKIKLIQEDLSNLESLVAYTFEDISSDSIKMNAVERLLEKIIMRALDINQHLVAEIGKGVEPVRGYEDTFLVLSHLSVYPKDFAEKIAPSAGLRNRLIHEYNNTKEEIIYSSVKEALKQYAQYCNYILQFVAKK